MASLHISRFKQTLIYTKKCFRIFKNEKGWKSFISAALITILISTVTGSAMFEEYQPTRNGSFALMSACIWIGIFNSIRSICRERDIIKREHRTGLHISAYVIAHWIYEACICFGEALITMVIVRAANFSHFPGSGIVMPAEIEMFITFFFIIFSADCLGLVISSIVKNENTAMTVMPFALIIQLIMCGMIFELEGIAKGISQLTISKWGLNALCAIADVNAMSPRADMPDYDHVFSNLILCWGIMLIFAVAYGIISIISLEFIDNDGR